jgi:hypothetical protein
VLDHHACAGEDPIEQSLPYAQLFAFGLFFWLLSQYARRLIALKAGVLVERSVVGVGNGRLIGVAVYPPPLPSP